MIMPRGEPLLLPVNPAFIWVSLLMGLAVNMVPLGRIVWMPDVLMVLIVFWGVQQPLRIGMGAAFVLGLCMDVSQSALLGQHALSYTVLSFGAVAARRRLLWFSVPSQAAQLLPLFALAHATEFLLRLGWHISRVVDVACAFDRIAALAVSQLGAVGATAQASRQR